MNKYEIEIISHHPEFKNKILKKYDVDGIETIGVWGNEPFEIKFSNHTSNKVQVKISVDGTDVLTGKPASTEINKNMWVVGGYQTLSLKAWPETNNGGAEFIFTSADNSVSFHTHGDLSCRGIIAAAVYEEGHVEPQKIFSNWYNSMYYGDGSGYHGSVGAGPSGRYDNTYNTSSSSYKSDNRLGVRSKKSTESLKTLQFVDMCESENLGELVAVGAGEHVDQKITYASGLISPKFAETIKVRYLWWDDLVSKLKEQKPKDVHPSGFPGDKIHKIMSIGKTPRISKAKKVAHYPSFSRF